MHNRTFVAEEAVEESRLADIGPPDDGDPGRARRYLTGWGTVAGDLVVRSDWEEVHHGIEQVPSAPSVERADEKGIAESQCNELPGRGFPVRIVHLVHDQPNRRSGATDHLGGRKVLFCHARGDVDDHKDDVGLGQRPLGLIADLGLQLVAPGQPTSGVHHFEGDPGPLGREHLPVARHALLLLDHGGACSYDPVHQ